MFVILSGELDVEKANTVIAKRKTGEYFGEMTLIESGPRSATIKAVAECYLLEITKGQFHSHFETNPEALMAVLKTVSERAKQDLDVLEKGMKDLEAQERKTSRLQDILNDTSNEIYTFDVSSFKFIHLNPRALKNLGYELKEAVELNAHEIFEDLNQEKIEHLVEPLRAGEKEQVVFNAIQKRKNGSLYDVEVHLKLITTETPPIFVGIVQDISEIRKIEGKVNRLTFYDPLTNLPNKKLLQENLSSALSRAKQGNLSVAVLFLGIDEFQAINNSFDHYTGDLLIKSVAQLLNKWTPQTSMVGRYGGDEFVVILSNINFETEAAAAARNLLKFFETPINIEGHDIYINFSIGISYYPLDGYDPETLIKQADTAKHFAKLKGKNTYCHYNSDMQFEIKNKLFLDRDLRQALEREEFELYYQPKLDLKSETITGAEALIRWNHPQRGLVPPLDFIPLAEKSNLIVPIGEWVLRTACRQLKTWQDMGIPIHNMAVNLSAQQFKQSELISIVADTIIKEKIYPECLELEITETVLMENMEAVVSKLKQLSSIGVKIALDDFGTGYSSLGYLNTLPLNTLKIDRTFVKDISLEEGAVIANAVISLAKAFNLKAIAEGIETEEQKEVLRSLGCDMMQGYLLSKPLPEQDMTQLLFSHK